MYCEYFKLNEKPFNLTPDPRYLFLGQSHSEAFAQLLYATQEGAGFAMFIGEIGTGKTTICRAFINQLPENYVPAFIFNPNMDELELYRSLNRELGIEHDSETKNTLQFILNRYLIDQKRDGRHVILIIDEAQNLSQPVLEQIRLISNLENETEKLIQIILVGQPELRDLLESSCLRQLKQRISVRTHLKPLRFPEMVEYIRHRMATAGGEHLELFTRSAYSRIFRFSNGTPRLINIICDRALLAAYSSGKRRITSPMIGKCIREIEGKVSLQAGYGKLASSLTVAVTLPLLFFALSYGGVATETQTSPPARVTTNKAVQTAYAEPATADSKEVFTETGRLKAAGSLLEVWNDQKPISESESRFSFIGLAKSRGLDCFEALMNYDQLRAVNYPVILELKDEKGRKGYVPIVSIWGKKFFTDGSGEKFFKKEWVMSRWTGRTYIFWKDFKSLPKQFGRGHQGQKVRWLQASINKLGYGEISPFTNFFGRKTQRSVIRFQIENHIEANGRVGPLTKMFIYKRLPEYATPGLT
jgi:general secretion pathway protein A